ncbi:hypothetical protein V6N11_015411 [Hibiscus sabdariffa]|uniref:Nucleobase-ascorbate transporter 11 n=1 Tax=Hibiscus sabdariffa TaxID=183260 RepID=A0ABR2TSP1_9ROSI
MNLVVATHPTESHLVIFIYRSINILRPAALFIIGGFLYIHSISYGTSHGRDRFVVAPTVAAIGLAFFSYGFPQAGSCVEVSVPLILLVLISGGAYDYKGCSPDIPSSNILLDECKKHAYTMKHCRTDVSNAWRAAAWVRIPYPLQWGVPIFHFRTSLIMIVVSLVASVDSISSLMFQNIVSSKPPTPGVVSRGIALEGFCSLLAGLWGSGTGSTTLTENTHTIYITKIASRRAVVFGALFSILFSFVGYPKSYFLQSDLRGLLPVLSFGYDVRGKVGAILASIPLSLAAAILCFMWALVVAFGLSTLQYTQTASFRNTTIVGVSLFLGLSIPAYFQQYQPMSSLMLPSYFVPYAAASDGPVHTVSEQKAACASTRSFFTEMTLSISCITDLEDGWG